MASICHNRKLGLLDLAEALQYYGQSCDVHREHFVLHNLAHLRRLLRKARESGGTGLCVVWDNSLRSLMVTLSARLLGARTAYYYHEPGGFGQKIFKSDPFFYSLKATLGEWFFRKVTDFHIVARPDKIGFGDVFCPLLFDDRRPRHDPAQPKLIGFVGAKRNQRLYNLFIQLVPSLEENGYRAAFFPSPEHGRSSAEKFAFLSRCAAVWNVYGVPYNQSGVTGDCVMSGTPMIHSLFEPYGALLCELNLSVELDLMKPPSVLAEDLFNKLTAVGDTRGAISAVSLSDSQSSFGGRAAFLNYWRPFFDGVEAGLR